MENNMMSLNISKDMLTPVIEQQVKLMMVEIMGGRDNIIDSVIKQVLSQKVDSTGNPCNYSNAKPFFEYLLRKELVDAVKELIHEEVKSQTSNIRNAVKRTLQSDRGAQRFSEALANGLEKTFEKSWTSQINVIIEPKGE